MTILARLLQKDKRIKFKENGNGISSFNYNETTAVPHVWHAYELAISNGACDAIIPISRAIAPSDVNFLTEILFILFHLDDMTLEQLESRDQAVFDRMCLKLDSGRWWFRRDYERLAAKYKRIPLEVRNALRDQLQIEGGSPSKLLMSHLQTKYPSLPLRYFVSTLKEIGRNDIVQLLMSYVGQNNSTSHP